MAYLTSEQIARVEEKFGTILPKYNQLLLTLPLLNFKNVRAAEIFASWVHAAHGDVGEMHPERLRTNSDGN